MGVDVIMGVEIIMGVEVAVSVDVAVSAGLAVSAEIVVGAGILLDNGVATAVLDIIDNVINVHIRENVTSTKKLMRPWSCLKILSILALKTSSFPGVSE